MAKKKDNHKNKTNAVRMVEAAGISYRMYEYDAPEGFLDGVSVAKSLGQNPGQVFKTLVTVGNSRNYYV
ncbi:MAG: Cys-tRNA(Pro) deacylase, partial [Anaerovoracaceae bacterium]